MENQLSPCEVKKNLRVTFDCTLCLKQMPCINWSVSLYRLILIFTTYRISRLLSKSVAVANALVGSRLDYCNYLMYMYI